MNGQFPATSVAAIFTNVFAILAWQDQIEWTLRIILTLLGIVTGVLALWHQIKEIK